MLFDFNMFDLTMLLFSSSNNVINLVKNHIAILLCNLIKGVGHFFIYFIELNILGVY